MLRLDRRHRRRAIASRSVTSKTEVDTFSPCAVSVATASASASCRRPLRTTVAPARARPCAMAKPRPRYAPVTSATLPERSNGVCMESIRRHAERRVRSVEYSARMRRLSTCGRRRRRSFRESAQPAQTKRGPKAASCKTMVRAYAATGIACCASAGFAARYAATSSASFAFAAFRCRSLTWP